MRSRRTPSEDPAAELAPEELAFFIINLPRAELLLVLLFDEMPDDERVKFSGTVAVATVAAATAELLLSSTGVAGALTLPRPSRK